MCSVLWLNHIKLTSRSAQGICACLDGSSCLDIQFATHKISYFCSNPRVSYSEDAKIGRHLKRTKDKGLMFNPNPNNDFEDCAES